MRSDAQEFRVDEFGASESSWSRWPRRRLAEESDETA
jgi:hypothetical protein